VNEQERVMSIKRGEGGLAIPLDALVARERTDPEPADVLNADRIYERRWALTVLEQVLYRVGEEYHTAGNDRLFDRFKELLAEEPDGISQAQIGAELRMTENAVKQAYHRFRRRYRELLREQIAHTVAVPGDIEDELRHLIAVLRA